MPRRPIFCPRSRRGELLLALALEESHKHNPYGIAATATKSDEGYAISGSKKFVLDGHVADKLIVAARTSGSAGERDGISLFLVDRKADGVSVTRTRMVDSRNAANVELADVAVGADALIGDEGQGADVLDPALDIARIGICGRNARCHPGMLRPHGPST